MEEISPLVCQHDLKKSSHITPCEKKQKYNEKVNCSKCIESTCCKTARLAFLECG